MNIPSWVPDAVFYQIFPERFRNGDPGNDPDRASLGPYSKAPKSWQPGAWSADWYRRASWEREMGESFYSSVFDRRYGGDLQGILDSLDYLCDLGVTAIYLNPISFAPSSHKYDASALHHVDPHFGPDPKGDLTRMAGETEDPASWSFTAADRLFLDLIAVAHGRGLRIVLDGVFNHTGRGFFAFDDLHRKQRQSRYREWYRVRRFREPGGGPATFEYDSWWEVPSLPAFAQTRGKDDLHPGPRKYLFDVTSRWMDPDGDGDPTDGVDGWRLDVAEELPLGFWRDWNARVREIHPDAYTVCEIWSEAGALVREGGFSAAMNYHGFAYPVKGFLVDGFLAASEFARTLESRRWPDLAALATLNLVESHDTQRLASMIVNAGRPYSNAERFGYDDLRRHSPRHETDYSIRRPDAREGQILRLVTLFQMTFPGVPMVYYGTEAGMWGGNDPDNRMPMIWRDLDYEAQSRDPRGLPRTPDPVAFDEELHRFYREVIRLRRENVELRRGSFRVVWTNDPAGTLAFTREHETGTVLVVLHRGASALEAEIPAGRRARAAPTPLLATPEGAGAEIRARDTQLRVRLPPRSGVVVRLA